MWEVGKALWRGESAAALVNLSVSWPPDLTLLTGKLRASIEQNVLRTVQRSYEQISLENLALRLSTTPPSLVPSKMVLFIYFSSFTVLIAPCFVICYTWHVELELMGWTVDRNAGVVRPALSQDEGNVNLIRHEANESKQLYSYCKFLCYSSKSTHVTMYYFFFCFRLHFRSRFATEDNWVRSASGEGVSEGGEVNNRAYTDIFYQ